MSLWTFSDIKRKVRRLTGRQSDNELSETVLNDYVNRYYLHSFPVEVMPLELNGWFEITLTADQNEYTLSDFDYDENFISFNYPVTIGSDNIILYTDPAVFYARYPSPEDNGSGLPYAVLFYNNMLTFSSPVSADHLDFRAAATRRPEELTTDSSVLIQDDWGYVVSYGTAKEILEDNGETEALSSVSNMYESAKVKLMRKFHKQTINQRSFPTF